jgi:FAD synthetase
MDSTDLISRIASFGLSCSFKDKFLRTIEILEDSKRLYRPETLALSFSGGKEACVLLYLLQYVQFKSVGALSPLSESIPVIHFHDPESFPELEEFNDYVARISNITYTVFRASYKEGMRVAVDEMGIRAMIMGVRRGDPYTDNTEHFQPSSPSWPVFMRINPILEWSYSQGKSRSYRT